MNLRATCVAFLAVVACAGTALAAAPLPGSYPSTDLGGSISTGRYTEGWAPSGGAMLPGTTQNCASWDGASLGATWRYTCGTMAGPGTVLSNTVDGSGNGNRTTACAFTGGVFWLSGSGPWGNGDTSYPGHFDNYVEIETVTFANGIPVAAVTNVSSSAHFDAYPATCLAFSIANGSRVGTTDLGNAMPANYPAMLDPACAATRLNGAWWNMTALTININAQCSNTPTKHSTWGGLKAVYR